MNEISSTVAFWILSAWCRMASQLHVRGTIDGLAADSAAVIRWSDPSLEKIALGFGQNEGQKDECRTSFKGAKFFFEVPESRPIPTFGEGIWLAFLLVKRPDGSQLLLGERFVASGFAKAE